MKCAAKKDAGNAAAQANPSCSKPNRREKRNSLRIVCNGQRKTLNQWAQSPDVTISASAIKARLKAGWPVEDALFKPDMRWGEWARQAKKESPACP